MSAGSLFRDIAARYGEGIALARDGVALGQGQAVLRPRLKGQDRFLPTELGVARQEEVLCLALPETPFDATPGLWTAETAAGTYRVLTHRLVRVGAEPVYWWAILIRQEEASP